MRTQTEIVDRLMTIADPLGAQRSALVECLEWEHARPFLVDDAAEAGWSPMVLRTDVDVETRMAQFMPVAWARVRDHRAFAANKSVEAILGWLYARGDDRVLLAMMDVPFAMYGAPRLRVVCQAYGWSMPRDRATRRMCEGKTCARKCDRGCGT